MKKEKQFILKTLITSLIIITLTTSCATNNKQESKKSENQVIEEIAEPEIPQPTEEELFIQEMNKYTLKFTNVPKKAKKGKEFSSNFEVTVVDENNEPAADFAVCFLYPSKKENSKIIQDSVVIKTDENGVASFNPGVVTFATRSSISAYPDITGKLESYYDVLPVPMAMTDFVVESDVTSKGAIMFVFEYTENGKPSKNSYEILSALRKKGVSQIGNAPISDTDYINASKEKIYKENYAYIEDQIDLFGYLIGGTIKFSSPVEKTDDGYVAKLCAEIYGIDMKTGEVIYENTHELEALGSNWNYAVSNCRDKLTEVVVDSIMFGL